MKPTFALFLFFIILIPSCHPTEDDRVVLEKYTYTFPNPNYSEDSSLIKISRYDQKDVLLSDYFPEDSTERRFVYDQKGRIIEINRYQNSELLKSTKAELDSNGDSIFLMLQRPAPPCGLKVEREVNDQNQVVTKTTYDDLGYLIFKESYTYKKIND